MQRFKDQLEADIDALSSRSSDPEEPEIFDQEGKTPAEIAAWCAEYRRAWRGKRRNRRLMAQRRRVGIAGIWHGGFSIIIVYSLISCLQPSELGGPALSLQLVPFLERVPAQQGHLRSRTRSTLLEASKRIMDVKAPPPSSSKAVRGLSQARELRTQG